MGLDPPTLLSLSPILRELAYKSSPRLILSLRPQDPIPDWITHLAILGLDYTLALAGPKEDVLFAVHRWSNAYGRPKCGTAAKMAALMTKRYGEPLTDFGHTLSSTGVSDYKTFSRVMSSPKPSYVQPNGEMAPEYLHPIDQQIWRQAAKVLRHEVDLDGLLALTCLLPKDFKCPVDGSPSSHEVSMVHSSRAPIETATQANPSPQSLTLNAFIELQNVIVSYGSKTVLGHGIQHGFTAPGLNLTIREGTRLALLGPNGSGKTTLLSLLTSDHPQSYSLPIKFFGRSRLPSQGQPGLSLWEIQSRIGHSSPEIHSFFPKGLTISRTLESAWAETFGAKPKLTEGSMKLVDVFLRWWEPELNPFHHPPPTPTQSTSTSAIDDWLSTSYPPAKPSLPNPDDLSWASSPTTTFSTLPFQSQRLLLLLRALIKNPDLVILDEAFSGFSPETRDKAMLFLRAGEGFMLQRRRVSTVENGKNNERDSGIEKRSPWSKALNHRHRIEQICQISGIAPEHLLRDRGTLPENIREIIDNLKGMTAMQLDQMTSNLLGADEDGNGKGYMFTGLKPKQALIVVSHVREEIPVVVNEYVRLPGEEEVSEMGRGVECGRFEDGLEGWNRIWGLGQRDV